LKTDSVPLAWIETPSPVQIHPWSSNARHPLRRGRKARKQIHRIALTHRTCRGPASGRCPLPRAHCGRPRYHAEKRSLRHQPRRIVRIGDVANARFLTFVAHMASSSQHRIVVRLKQIVRPQSPLSAPSKPIPESWWEMLASDAPQLSGTTRFRHTESARA
jgi:hypothetical protein